jgi:hypothetical protein
VGRDGDLEELTYNIADSDPNTEIGLKYSQDMTVNNYGRSLLEFCKASGYRIMNGRLHNDKNIGEFTYESDLGRSVIDLLICKPSDSTLIKKFSILAMQPTESDHKPIYFNIWIPSIKKLQCPISTGVVIVI